MKSISKYLVAESETKESTKLEETIMGANDHPFLAEMLYVFHTESKIHYVMRFLRGGELFEALRREPKSRITEARAKFYIMQAVLAVGQLHKQNIIHRDLKPENILLDEEGYICVTDFGLSKVVEEGKQAKTMCGTPDYIAPEILLGKGYSYGVDWWTIGILAYEMICGMTPFAAKNTNV